jgi:hypothetical protein
MSTENVNKRGPVRDVKQVYRFALENFKKDEVLVRVVEHPSGEWEIKDKMVKVQIGEDTDPDKKEEDANFDDFVTVEKKDVNNVIFHVKLPPTTKEKKYILYYTLYLRNIW